MNRVLVTSLPFLPRSVVGAFASRYVAGETVATALQQARDLNEKGFEVTLDILGEHVQDHEEARLVTDAYIHLYDQIAAAGIRGNISLKPTHLGLELDYHTCEQNLLRILEAAKANGNFLRIDMENSPYTDATLQLYHACLERYDRVGPVLQAYLHRSSADLAAIMSPKLNFRLCKGIYQEPENIAIQDRQGINRNYMALARQAFEGLAYVAIATHDLELITDVENFVQELGVPAERFEFQVLYGVPMKGRLEQLLAKGYRVRVYVPFGATWYDYAMRRLKENPSIAGYVMSNFFRK